LLIVDEEHKFGVARRKDKRTKQEVDVLNLVTLFPEHSMALQNKG
jgi:transcription-repair coupling factor (superfamily II helicase)